MKSLVEAHHVHEFGSAIEPMEQLEKFGITSEHSVCNGLTLCENCHQQCGNHLLAINPSTHELVVADSLQQHSTSGEEWTSRVSKILRAHLSRVTKQTWLTIEVMQHTYDVFLNLFVRTRRVTKILRRRSCWCLPALSSFAASFFMYGTVHQVSLLSGICVLRSSE